MIFYGQISQKKYEWRFSRTNQLNCSYGSIIITPKKGQKPFTVRMHSRTSIERKLFLKVQIFQDASWKINRFKSILTGTSLKSLDTDAIVSPISAHWFQPHWFQPIVFSLIGFSPIELNFIGFSPIIFRPIHSSALTLFSPFETVYWEANYGTLLILL